MKHFQVISFQIGVFTLDSSINILNDDIKCIVGYSFAIFLADPSKLIKWAANGSKMENKPEEEHFGLF
jgi:hypothetical protein